MPNVLIDGQIKGKDNVELYVHNLCYALNIHRMKTKLIQVYFVTKADGTLANAWGCPKEGYAEINVARKPEGVRIPYEELMQNLAHEMVHVKQFFRKELDGSNWQFKWKGRNANGYKYENQPWEREAYKLEEKLYKQCWPS